MWSKAIIALLPLFYENANSVAITKHAMTCITKEAIESWPNSGYYNRSTIVKFNTADTVDMATFE